MTDRIKHFIFQAATISPTRLIGERMTCFSRSALAIGLLLAGTQLSAQAVDSASLEFGTGNRTQYLRAGLQWNFQRPLYQSDNLLLRGYWDLDLAQWRGNQYRDRPGAHQNITEIGFTPMFRVQKPGSRLFAEAGVGAHLLSHVYDNNARQLSTALEFGSKLGIGYSVTPATDIGLSVQHYSNAGIKHPNGGVNFASVRLLHQF
jgi:lipid A 3-O-deacylase